jgi:hypothetical protein
VALTCRRRDIIAVNIHAPTDNGNDREGSYSEKVQEALDTYKEEHMKMFLREVNMSSGRDDIFIPKFGNKRCMKI